MSIFHNIRPESLPPFLNYSELLNYIPPFDGYTVITIDDDTIYSWNAPTQIWVAQPTSAAVINLEDKYVRTTRFATISSGTTGTITLPPNSTVVLNDFGGTTDAVTSQISGGRPTYTSAVTSLGAVVATTFDTSANYTLSDTPSSYPIAILYRVQQFLKDFDSTSSDIVGGPEIIGSSGGGGGTPGGPTNSIQTNASGSFLGYSTLLFDGAVLIMPTSTYSAGILRINTLLGVLDLGDVVGSGNHTHITIDDNDLLITMNASDGIKVLSDFIDSAGFLSSSITNRILVNSSTVTLADWSGSGLSLSGIPIAPTATHGTNTTQLATTAFVQSSIGPIVSSQWVTTGSDIYYSIGNVMIGQAIAPSSKLHVVETVTSTSRGVLADQVNTGVQGSRITMRKARGTLGSLSTIVTGDTLGSWTASGYDGTNYVDAIKIIAASTGTISTGVVPTTLALQTTTASGALTTALTLNSDQSAIFANKLTINGTITGLASAFGVTINGQGGLPTTGTQIFLISPPYSITLNQFTIQSLLNSSGAITFDLKILGTSIIGGGGNAPILTSGSYISTAISGWTTPIIPALSAVEVIISSVSGIVGATLVLSGTRS